jgi:tetratricopeptide (TPR) repeat protein
MEGQTLFAERKLRLRQRELSAERLPDYQAFVLALQSDSAQTLSLESTVAGTPSIPDSAKTEDLRQAGEAAAKNENFGVAEQLFKRVLEKDPKDKTVRRFLGYVLFEQRKFDEAITVLREQTKINPFEDFAYNMLGRVYWQQDDYANAEQSFRKQIEVTPLDQTAHANLGRMLVEWGKYKDAVPELERAISLAPEDEMLRVSVGRAYLNLGETQKSMAAFEEAVKLDRSPQVLNDVAYFLAEEGVQLDKALQYAESAVTGMAINLRNLETGALTIEDLDGVSSLASYWDTLGWVYYKKGDLDNAERYLKAAWTLLQAGVVGYHVGMIAEKRGKKDEAIRLYAQGASALSTSSEAEKSLRRLAAPASIEKMLQTAKQDLREHNVYGVGQLVPNLKTPVEAEFYLVYAPDSTRNAQAIDVKFIKGDERLKSFAAQLKEIKYPLVFPDASPTKVIRRGALLCLPKPGVCTFTMVSPELVMSVD